MRLAEKKRFTYKSAYLYEQIRKMHELQEEYLVVVRYDVKSYGDLFRLKLRLQQVDEELCKAQQEMYRDRALQKRTCKTAEDLEFFEASEDDYRERLKQRKQVPEADRRRGRERERLHNYSRFPEICECCRQCGGPQRIFAGRYEWQQTALCRPERRNGSGESYRNHKGRRICNRYKVCE